MFVLDEFLRQDGVFCLRLIAKNVPDVVTAEIVTQLYLAWRKDAEEKEVMRYTSSFRKEQ